MGKNKEFDINSSELYKSLQENQINEGEDNSNLKIIDLAPLRVCELFDSYKDKGLQHDKLGLSTTPDFETVEELIEYVRYTETMSSSGGSSKGKGGNKRKSSDPSPPKPVKSTSSLTEFPRYDSKPSFDKSSSSQPNPATQQSQPSQWDDPLARQLEGILMNKTHTIFKIAIKQLVDCGYTEEVAERTIYRMGFYRGGTDIVGNIVNDALGLLKSGKDVNSVKDVDFESLNQMVEYTVVEMVNVLVQVKPKLSIAEAMWWLLIVDMDIVKACEVEGDLVGELGKEISVLKDSSDSAVPQPDAPTSLSQPLKFGSFPSSVDLKKAIPRPATSGDVNRQLTEEDMASLKHLVHGVIEGEKVVKSSSKPLGVRTKGCTSKFKGKIEAPGNASSALSVSNDTSKSSASVGASTQIMVSENKSPSKPEASSSEFPKASDYVAGIPFDKSSGKYIPRDSKDELILKLVGRAKELQKEVQNWNDWANQKVMEVTNRLSRDRLELKTLKKEKEEAEKLKKEMKLSEENAAKRMLEMQNAIVSAANQVTAASDKVIKLEAERNTLFDEMEAAKLRAVEAAANCEEALAKEQKAMKDAQSWRGHKIMLQEELETHKQKTVELQQELSKAEKVKNQIQAKLKRETEQNEELLKQAASLKHEREQLEAAAKAEEDMIKQNAEQELAKYTEDIKMIEKQISELKVKSESSSMGALRGEMGGNHPANFLETFGISGLKRERECVMCLSEEAGVVFMPCAHEVLCIACNEIHERIGTTNCPSCRTLIQKRITVRFDRP